MIMKIIKYLLIAFVATVPGLWIENYSFTTPIWWTVVLAHLIGRLFGYFEGLKNKEKKDEE